MLYSAWSHRRTSFAAEGEHSIDLLKWGMVVEWQKVGKSVDAWRWKDEDRDWLEQQGDQQEFAVGYRISTLARMLGISLVGLVVMGVFAPATLPYLDADFAKGATLVLIVTQCLAAGYCGWLGWCAIDKMWRQSQGRLAYRVTDEFRDHRCAWNDLKGIGRTMSPSHSGERLNALMLWLPDKSLRDLDLSSLDCRPERLGVQLEYFWCERHSEHALWYASRSMVSDAIDS